MPQLTEDALVSIILPCYNAEAYLENAIDSVIQQEYTNWELLIVDDASTDTTAQVAKSFAQTDSRIEVFVNNENQGPGLTRNIGINHSKGRFLAFIDSDDLWRPEKLLLQVNYMTQHQLPFTITSYYRVAENKKRLISVPKLVNYQSLCKDPSIATDAVMLDMSIMGRPQMKDILYEDLNLWLDLLGRGFHCHGIAQPLCTVNIRQGSLSRNKFLAPFRYWNVIRNVQQNSIPFSMYHLMWYLFNLSVKYLKNTLNIDDKKRI